MAYDRDQEAYELSPTHAGTADAATARRPCTASRQLIEETNFDSPISDDHGKDKAKNDDKAQQPGMGDYFVSCTLATHHK
jgi:hypothetical protein